MYSYSKFEHNHTKSFFKYVEPISEDYRVFLNGEEMASSIIDVNWIESPRRMFSLRIGT